MTARNEKNDHQKAANANETLRLGLLVKASDGMRKPKGFNAMLDAVTEWLKNYYGGQ